MIKAFVSDFDGTLVTEDILTVISGLVGKEEESRKINQEFWKGKRAGLGSLVERINFLHGVSVADIRQKLDEQDYLMPGAEELFRFLRERKIVTILHSGNILPVLEYYKDKLGIDYIVGTRPRMDGDKIDSIYESDFSGPDFKLDGVKKVLESLGISPPEIVAIGDSPADRKVFEYAGKSIAINPKEGVEAYADEVIKYDLSKVIPFLG